jgi:AbrB family looped-hinge helix DNA binding protein
MSANTPEPQRIFRSRIDSSGRVVIPVALRSGLYVAEGDSILFVQQKGGVELRTGRQAAHSAQEFFCGLADSEVRMSDELLAERRDEAQRT